MAASTAQLGPTFKPCLFIPPPSIHYLTAVRPLSSVPMTAARPGSRIPPPI